MSKRNRSWYFIGLVSLAIIAIFWTLLTLWVEQKGPSRAWTLDNKANSKKVLIIFDPDPIYNLDEQLCLSLAKGFFEKSLSVKVITVAAIDNVDINAFDGYALCANTYNWAPDWAIVNLIESTDFINNKPVVALTVGSGSTSQSQATFENVIRERGGILINSSSRWLMRPNDELRMEEKNVDVANDMTYRTGLWLAEQILNLH